MLGACCSKIRLSNICFQEICFEVRQLFVGYAQAQTATRAAGPNLSQACGTIPVYNTQSTQNTLQPQSRSCVER